MAIALPIMSALGFLTAAGAYHFMAQYHDVTFSWMQLISSGSFFVAMAMGVMCAFIAILQFREDHLSDV